MKAWDPPMPGLVRFVRDRFVPLFERGVLLLERDASAGSESARRQLDDVRGFRGATRIDLDSTPVVFVAFEDGRVTVGEEPPSVPVRTALDLPGPLAERWIGEILLAKDSATDASAIKAAALVSKRVDEAIGAEPLELHLCLLGTPNIGDATLRIGLGAAVPPERPRFTATVAWSDLEAMRETGSNVQQLFLAGKLRLAGDYSRALVLAMRLAQDAPRPN
jgi:hypothetical protein